MDEQEFVSLLESLLLPDTERVKSATSTLNKTYYSSPASLGALIHILSSHPKPELRQLAAVEARKLVQRHWANLPADQKPQLRNSLLQSSLNEEVNLTQHSVGRVVAAVAAIDFEDGDWADLPGFLVQACTEQNPRHREVGVHIIYSILESAGDRFPGIKDLYTLFNTTLQDPESIEVRVNTMLCLGQLSMLLDTEEDPKGLEMLRDTIPHMVNVLKTTVEQGDEGHAMQAFDVFQTFLAGESALLSKHFADLFKFMSELAASTNVEDDYRTQALSYLTQCVRFRKLKVQGLRLGEDLTLKSLQIATELGDIANDDEDATPARAALGLLDNLATCLPPSQVVIPLLKALGSYFSSPNPDYRQAAILSLGMCVEGAPDFIQTQLHEILPMVLHLLADPELKVRAAALNGLARLADDLAEDVAKEHVKIIPVMVKNFDSAVGSTDENSLQIMRGTWHAIDSLIEGLDAEDAAKYATELVPRVSALFQHDDERCRAAAIAAIGSIASASGEAFLPYFEQTMKSLAPYVTIKESHDDLELRGVTCDSIGKIASAVGAKAFEPYVRPLMEASEEALHLDHPRLRETSYIIWSTMAKIYEQDFAKYLAGAVKGLRDCLHQDETGFDVGLGEQAQDLVGTEVVIEGKKVRVASASNDDDDLGGEMGNIMADDSEWDELTGVSAVAMEKEIAAEVLGDIIAYVQGEFLPYIEDTVTDLLQLVEHSYEGVRKATVSTLWRCYGTLWQLSEKNGMTKWKPGLPLQVESTEDLKKLGNLVMTATMSIWQDEMDRGTVTDINRSVHATLNLTGPSMLLTEQGTVLPQMAQLLLAIITKRHPCQQEDEEDVEEVLDESAEYDWLLIETAMDVVTALSAALGPAFGELWKMFEKPIMKHASGQDAFERASAVGVIAETISNMGDACTPYTSNLMKLLVHRLSDEDPETKSNSVYGVGLLCEKSANQDEVLKSYRTIFEKIEPLVDANNNQARLLDNTAGCLSRMIMKHPDKIPIGDILPRLVDLLPLREDYDENTPIFNMIVKLYQANEPTVQQLTPRLMGIFEKVLGPPEEQLTEETRVQVVELVKYLQK